MTTRYAYIVNGIVHEVFEVQDLAQEREPNFAAMCQPCGPEVQEGWTWDGAVFSAPAEEPGPGLEAVKAAKLAAIQAEKNRARDGGFPVGGVLFDSDAGARLAYIELENKLSSDPTFTTSWKASDGVWVTMDAMLYAQVKAAGTAHISACFAWQAAREAEVAAAQTIAEVEAVSAVYGG